MTEVEFKSGPLPYSNRQREPHHVIYIAAVTSISVGTLVLIAALIALSLHVTVGGLSIVTTILAVVGAVLLIAGYICSFVLEVKHHA